MYKGYVEGILGEEERAEKQIEHSYIMLHIYWNESMVDPLGNHETERQDPLFEARVVTTDLILSDALKLLKSMTNHDALYSVMSKLVLFRGNLPLY